jgi:hypothetical protein
MSDKKQRHAFAPTVASHCVVATIDPDSDPDWGETLKPKLTGEQRTCYSESILTNGRKEHNDENDACTVAYLCLRSAGDGRL